MRDYVKINSLKEYQTKDESLNILVEKINELFITLRKKYITDKYAHSYMTIKRNFTDNTVKNSLKHNETLVIFCPTERSKFITFDIDVNGDLTYAERIAKEIHKILIDDIQATNENIVVNYSGNKGLHVHLLFKELVSNHVLKFLYNYVMYKLRLTMKNITENQVEYRPTSKQGIKMPLQVHPKTKNVCNLLDITNNFEVLNPYSLLNNYGMEKDLVEISTLEIKQENPNLEKMFLQKHNTLRVNSSSIINRNNTYPQNNVDNLTNIKNTSVDENQNYFKNISQNCSEMIDKNRLLHPNTRHNATVGLATYLNTMGKNYDEAVEIISGIIQNTFTNFRQYIDKDTTLNHALKEVKRLTKTAFERNYRISEGRSNQVSIYQREISKILSIDKKAVRDIALILLMHDKKYNPNKTNRTFTLSYRQVNDILGTNKSFKSIKQAYDYLEDLGYISITNKEEIANQKNYKDTTKFKINFRNTDEEENEKYLNLYIETINKAKINVDYLAVLLFNEQELREFYTKSTLHRKVLPLQKEAEVNKDGLFLHTTKILTPITLISLKELTHSMSIKNNVLDEVSLVMPKFEDFDTDLVDGLSIDSLEEIDLKYKLWQRIRKMMGNDFIKS